MDYNLLFAFSAGFIYPWIGIVTFAIYLQIASRWFQANIIKMLVISILLWPVLVAYLILLLIWLKMRANVTDG